MTNTTTQKQDLIFICTEVTEDYRIGSKPDCQYVVKLLSDVETVGCVKHLKIDNFDIDTFAPEEYYDYYNIYDETKRLKDSFEHLKKTVAKNLNS